MGRPTGDHWPLPPPSAVHKPWCATCDATAVTVSVWQMRMYVSFFRKRRRKNKKRKSLDDANATRTVRKRWTWTVDDGRGTCRTLIILVERFNYCARTVAWHAAPTFCPCVPMLLCSTDCEPARTRVVLRAKTNWHRNDGGPNGSIRAEKAIVIIVLSLPVIPRVGRDT